MTNTQPGEFMFAGVWYVATVVAVGVMSCSNAASAPSPAPLVFMIFPARPYTAQCANRHAADSGILVAHGAAKLILVKFRYSARSSGCWVLRFASSSVKPAIYSRLARRCTAPDQPSPAPCQMQQRIAFSGQRFGLIFVHRKEET